MMHTLVIQPGMREEIIKTEKVNLRISSSLILIKASKSASFYIMLLRCSKVMM